MPRKDKIYSAYHCQLTQAKRRGLAFEFTYEEWIRWWESHLGPDWFQMRGKGSGKFVMSRKLDTGPYAPHNVECKTFRRNIQESFLRDFNGSQRNANLTSAQIAQIKTSDEGPMKIARRLGISRHTVTRIRKGKAFT